MGHLGGTPGGGIRPTWENATPACDRLLLAPTPPLSDVAHSLIPECHDERPRSLDEATKEPLRDA